MKRIILTLLSAVITLIVSAQEKDTTIVILYGYQAIDISKSSEIYLQMQDAELVVKGITDDPTKHRAIVEYVLSHPDSDGSLYLMRYLSGMINYKKCLPALSERVRHGIMKRLYDFFIAAEAETDAYLSKTAEAIAIDKITEAVGQSTNPANYLLAQKYIQMLDTVASGDKTKTVYLPYEATNLLGSIGGIKELFGSDGKKE